MIEYKKYIIPKDFKIDCIPRDFTGVLEYEDGRCEYFLNGLLHNFDGPAWIDSWGRKYYFLFGKDFKSERELYDSEEHKKHRQNLLLENLKKIKNC